MTKADLIAIIRDTTGSTKKKAAETIEKLLTKIGDTIAEGKKVQLIGFGTFESRQRAAKKGRNPQTKAEIIIPATVVPVFKAGKALKDKVSSKK